MRKFRKSIDNGAPSCTVDEDKEMGLNSPRLSRKFRGSFSGNSGLAGKGPSLPDGLNGSGDLPPASPASRRRRSRIPSEEDVDDSLMNFLTTSGNSRERGLSVGESPKSGPWSFSRFAKKKIEDFAR